MVHWTVRRRLSNVARGAAEGLEGPAGTERLDPTHCRHWALKKAAAQRASSADVRQRSWLTVGWSGMLGNFLLFTCNLSVVVPSDFTLSQWDT